MVRAGCVFVAGIHLSRAWTSGSFESVQWNAQCVHRLDLGLYSHLKEFLGNGVWTHVNSKGKIPSTWKISPEEDRTRDAVDSEPKLYQRAIPAPERGLENRVWIVETAAGPAIDRAWWKSLWHLPPPCAPQKQETGPDGDPSGVWRHLVHHRSKRQGQTEIPLASATTLCTTEARDRVRRRSLWYLAPPCAPQKQETEPDRDPLYHLVHHRSKRQGQMEIPLVSGTTVCTTEARDCARQRSLYTTLCTTEAGDRARRRSLYTTLCTTEARDRARRRSLYTTLCTTEARDRARWRSLYTTLCTTEARNRARWRSLWCLAPPCAPQKQETVPDRDPSGVWHHLVHHRSKRQCQTEISLVSGTTLCTTEARNSQTEIPLYHLVHHRSKKQSQTEIPLYHLVYHRSKRQCQTEIPLYHLMHHRSKRPRQTEIPLVSGTTLCTTEARDRARRRSLWCLAPPCAPQKRETEPDGDPLYQLVHQVVQRGLTDEMDFFLFLFLNLCGHYIDWRNGWY